MSFVRLATLIVAAVVAASACVNGKMMNSTATAAPASETYDQFQKVVYQNSGGLPDDRAYFLRVLRNIGAHVAATEGNVEIRLVSFSGGVKVFQQAKSDPELAKAIDEAREKNVRFLLCRNTMRAMNLTADDVYGAGEADIVASGVAELARLQGQGFVYIHP